MGGPQGLRCHQVTTQLPLINIIIIIIIIKLSPVPGLDTWPVQLVANRYTDYAIAALFGVENSYSLWESYEAYGAFHNVLRDYKYL
jgi:hypothetical protein